MTRNAPMRMHGRNHGDPCAVRGLAGCCTVTPPAHRKPHRVAKCPLAGNEKEKNSNNSTTNTFFFSSLGRKRENIAGVTCRCGHRLGDGVEKNLAA